MTTPATSELPAPRSWEEFEDIVWELHSRLWNDPRAERNGRTGQTQNGVDIYGRERSLGTGYIGIQCKRYSAGALTAKDIEDEIKKAESFSPPLSEYIVATTDRRDSRLQLAVREINERREQKGEFPVRLLFWEDICSRLTDISNLDIFNKYYVWPSAPSDQQSAVVDLIHAITNETFLGAKKRAALQLAKLREARASLDRTDDYDKLANESSLLGGALNWDHLYMEEFGAFSRPEKEAQVLSEIDANISKLAEKQHGVILHVLSGDSGSGKSTLARLVIRRIVERRQLEGYPALAEQTVNVFELIQLGSLKNLSAKLRKTLAPTPEGAPLALIFFDDLFAQEEESVDALLTVLMTAAQETPIYLLVTSPSWIFDSKKDLVRKKLTFHLFASKETHIGGMDAGDKQALKTQYLAMYGDNARPDLLKSIEQAEDAIILIKLGLHHGMEYSKYIEQLLDRLEKREPRCLAALLLFSILARFYVHFPMPLLKAINQQLTRGNLPETWQEYETINYRGLRLFRVRHGTRESDDSPGMPDTAAPFHDRIAQVIYHSWGANKQVPIFELPLDQLSTKVYEMLDGDPQAQPVLAKVFRGQLRVAEDEELRLFISGFGPVRGERWAFRGAPLSAFRWITYARFNVNRTIGYQEKWREVLRKSLKSKSEIELTLVLACIQPDFFRARRPELPFAELKDLGANYSPLILAALDRLLYVSPPPYPVLDDFLSPLADWLEAHTGNPAWRPTPCFLALLYLQNSFLLQEGKRLEGTLGRSLIRITKTYLLRLQDEYVSQELFSSSGLIRLAGSVYWAEADARELISILVDYIADEHVRFKPTLAEVLFQMGSIIDTPIDVLFRALVEVCRDNPSFMGLTYVAEGFDRCLRRYARRHNSEYRQFLAELVSNISTGELNVLTSSMAYPDFARVLVKHLASTRQQVSQSDVLALLKPLFLSHAAYIASSFVMTEAVTLNLGAMDSEELIADDTRELAICLAAKAGMHVDDALSNLTSLLETREVKLMSAVTILLSRHLRASAQAESITPFVEQQVRRLCAWLIGNMGREEAPLRV